MQVRLFVQYFVFFFLVITALSLVTVAQAQTNQEALNEIRRAIELEEQRRADERRRLQESQRTHTQLETEEAPQQDVSADDGPCFTINKVIIDGASLLSEKTLRNTYQDQLGQCIGIAQINNIVSRITQQYIDAGYVTSRAYIPQQNLASGDLRISVVEGYIESIRLEGGPKRLLATAFPGLIGKPLNLREIEQGLDQLNRLRSANATIQFVPGSELGASEVVIQYRESEPVSINIGYNNSGQESTGVYKVSAGGGWDNPLGINDFIYLNHSTNARDEGEGKKSESTSLHYSLPFGYWNFAVDASQFEYANLVTGSATTFETRGTSDVLQISIDRLLSRNQTSKTIASLHIKEQAGENYIDDVLLLTSSRDDTVLGLDLSREMYLPGNTTLIMSAGYARGLKAEFHSEAAQDAPDAPPEDFEKYLLDVTLLGAVQALGNVWQWRTELHGQYSDDLLFSSESFSIGSQYTVRGFKEDGLSGDTGIYWRNEISLPAYPFPRAPRFRTEPYIGIDTGVIDNGLRNESLTGWAIGLRLSGANVSAQVNYAQPIDHPDYLVPDKNILDFSLTFSKSW
jgi:hemolysin activation/secretion protein